MDLGNINSLINRIEALSTPDFNITRNFTKKILPYVTDEILGKGAAGSTVRAVQIPKREPMVLKEIEPCGINHELFIQYCRELLDSNSTIHLPYGEKDQVLIPNGLMEGIIGGYMERLASLRLTPHFAPIYGAWIDPNLEVIYSLQPRYENDLSKILKKPVDFYLTLFQIAQGLSVGQEMYHFTHYDLHSGNIFYKDEKKGFLRSYPVIKKDGSLTRIAVSGRGYCTKIADYGLSRMETDEIVISATSNNYPIRNGPQFNRNYDMATVSRFLIHSHGNSILSNNDIADIYSIVFGKNKESILKSIDAFEATIYEFPGWRPKGIPFIQYFKAPSIHTIVRRLAEKLVDMNQAKPYEKNFNINEVIEPLSSYKLIKDWLIIDPPVSISANVKSLSEILNPQPSIAERALTIAPGISVRTSIFRYTENPKISNWTITKDEAAQCPNKLQYIHMVSVDSKKMKMGNYEIKLQCCDLDILDYLADNFGVAINGTFFNLKSYKPVGGTKISRNNSTNDFLSNNPQINPVFQKYYGTLIFDDEGLSIGYGTKIKNLDVDYAHSGPLLIKDGQIVFDETVLNTTINYQDNSKVRIFQCRLPQNEAEINKNILPPGVVDKMSSSCVNFNGSVTVSDYIPNCRTIIPGELSHAGNSNPRTMVLTRKEKGDLMFVYVEGRDDRGMGLDMVDLAILAHDLGAEAALNLDGGRSSGIAWRSENDPDHLVTANPNHKSFYPVGNIISISPKRK